MDLEPISPERAVELYLRHRRGEVANTTLRSHSSRLDHFIEWCEDEEITNLNELSGRDLYEFRTWRKKDGDLAKNLPENPTGDTSSLRPVARNDRSSRTRATHENFASESQ